MPTRLSVHSVGEEGELGPGGRIVGGDGGHARDGQVDAEGEAEFLALEPARQRGGDGDDLRFGAQTHQGTAGDHRVESCP